MAALLKNLLGQMGTNNTVGQRKVPVPTLTAPAPNPLGPRIPITPQVMPGVTPWTGGLVNNRRKPIGQ